MHSGSRWQAPEPLGQSKAYLPTLSLQHLEVRLDSDGCVEMQNCILCGVGASAASPTGITDSVLRVSKGTCLVADCQIRIGKGQSGFGVVVGPDVTSFMDGVTKPHCMLKQADITAIVAAVRVLFASAQNAAAA